MVGDAVSRRRWKRYLPATKTPCAQPSPSSRTEEKYTPVDGRVVPLEVGLLFESLVADAADVLGWYPALVVEMTLQAALVPVGSTAFVARKRLRQEILSPRRRIPAPRAITWNLEDERLQLFDPISIKLAKKRVLVKFRSSMMPVYS